ncbi:MAG: geranylgeranylglyceryl/heptaprenylglyceryl phosphate synthase [Flavobacterium sp.]|nr:geranylgeranylglyceryl/heptaprenylglyceryl phosphate synthase [Flavobacterium sp.]
MQTIYNDILKSRSDGEKLMAVLIDPDKVPWNAMELLITRILESPATHIFVGGSQVFSDEIDFLVGQLKNCGLPVLIFPGHPSQVSKRANGLLLLSLISGRNPDYLIGHHVESALNLKSSGLEIIPTGYILIDGGNQSAVSRISKTAPLATTDVSLITATAVAGEMLGNKLIYLEAGSGAVDPVSTEIIKSVRIHTSLPLIVGGGLRSKAAVVNAYEAGADMVVIGTAFENNIDFFNHD